MLFFLILHLITVMKKFALDFSKKNPELPLLHTLTEVFCVF